MNEKSPAVSVISHSFFLSHQSILYLSFTYPLLFIRSSFIFPSSILYFSFAHPLSFLRPSFIFPSIFPHAFYCQLANSPVRHFAISPVRQFPPSPTKKKRASFWDTLFQL
jgi:hypothetical protein